MKVPVFFRADASPIDFTDTCGALLCMGARWSQPNEPTVDMSAEFGNVVVGVVGTGMMAGAHAYRHSQIGLPVFVGSRDPAKGKKLAQSIGGKCEGGSQAEMVEKASFIILAIPSVRYARATVARVSPHVHWRRASERRAPGEALVGYWHRLPISLWPANQPVPRQLACDPPISLVALFARGLPGADSFLHLCSATPQTSLIEFLDTHRAALVGKGKMFCDLSVTFSRYGSPAVQPPTEADGPNWRGPYYDYVSYMKDRLDDPSATWVKAWHNLSYRSIANNKVQPVECAGDQEAKAMAMKILTAEGWEPLDCGGIADVPKIETGFHERRWRHPRHLEFNGPNHP